MKANKRKRFLILVLLVTAALFAFEGVRRTGAYFSDYANAKASVAVKLSHRSEIVETIDEDNLSKHITIKNTGESDILVRVAVYGGSYVEVAENGDWEEEDGFYYYRHVLKAGESATELFAKVNKEEAPEYDFDIVVILESERALYDGDDIKNPWTGEIYAEGGNVQ